MSRKFSIIIPTKNRPSVIQGAIESCLLQTYGDLEIVVVDNDDEDLNLRSIVENFKDSRLKYVRAGGLSHADNWERGWESTTGDYVALLHDKTALRPNAVETAASELERNPGACVLWRSDFLSSLNCEPGKPVLFERATSGKVIPYTNRDCLRQITSLPYPRWEPTLPVISHGFIPRHHLEAVLEGPAGRIFSDIPDFSQAYRLLAVCDKYILCDWSLAVGCDQGGSTAAQFDRGDQKVAAKEKFTDERLCSHVPVKVAQTRNMILNQYLLIREELAGSVLDEFPLPLDVYYTSVAQGLMEITSAHPELTRGHLLTWAEALSKEAPAVRDRVFTETGSLLLPFLLRGAVVADRGISAFETLHKADARSRELKAAVAALKLETRGLKAKLKSAEKQVPTLGAVIKASLRSIFSKKSDACEDSGSASSATVPTPPQGGRERSPEAPAVQTAPLFSIDVVKAVHPQWEIRRLGQPVLPLN